MFLEVFEHVSDFLPCFFGEVHGHVLAFLGASCRVERYILTCVNRGMTSNDKGFFCAIGSLYGNRLGALTHILHGTFSRMDCLVADPFDRMSRLVGTLSYSVNDHMAAFFAGEISSLCCIFEAVNSRPLSELHRFDAVVGSLHCNCLRAGIDFFNSAGNDVC